MRNLGNYIFKLIDGFLARIFCKSEFLSAIYYSLFSRSFYREFISVLQGRLEYMRNVKSIYGCEFHLRRNIHRIEKGLIMRPRKDVFGKDYIEETLESFKKYVNRKDFKSEMEFIWYKSVLEKYFQTVIKDPDIENLKHKYNEIVSESHFEVQKVPYIRDLSKALNINLNDLRNLAVRRRSVRWFQNKEVPRELIDKAIKVAIMAPSACNRLPFEFRIFDDKELVKKISSIPGGTRGFYQNFQVIVVVIGKLNAYFSERDRHLIYIDSSLAAMGFLYALEVQGISSCIINWPDIKMPEKSLRKILNIKKYERVIMLISVGYADHTAMVPYSEKKSLSNIRSYNRIN